MKYSVLIAQVAAVALVLAWVMGIVALWKTIVGILVCCLIAAYFE